MFKSRLFQPINSPSKYFDSNENNFFLFRISSAQLISDQLNIITGFHLFDDEKHLFVLEGRKEDAIDILYKQLPKPEGQSRLFF
jgi:hypothetical protein